MLKFIASLFKKKVKKLRVHGPAECMGPRSFHGGGRALPLLRKAMTLPSTDRNTAYINREFRWSFCVLTHRLKKTLAAIEAAGYGQLRVETFLYGMGSPRFGGGRWTQVDLIGFQRKF
jgi:hypothetical protein